MTSSAPAAKPLMAAWKCPPVRSARKNPSRGRERAERRDAEPEQADSARAFSRLAHVRRRADRLRQVRDEDRDQQRDAHAFAGGDSDSEHDLLRDPVEERPERQRGSAAGAGAPRLQSTGQHEVDERPGSEPEPDSPRSTDRDALLEELEADTTHERAGPERKHEPDQPARPLPSQAENHADHERGRSNDSPTECPTHVDADTALSGGGIQAWGFADA
jgi:hypothetical protein